MKTQNTVNQSFRIPRNLIAAGALAALAATFFMAPQAAACDACNLAIGKELENERADSLMARDMRVAMKNQSGLPLDGFASPVVAELMAGQRADLARATAMAETTDASASNPQSSMRADGPAAAAAPANPLDLPAVYDDEDFIEIIHRDMGLPIPQTGYVPQDIEPDKSFTIVLDEGSTYLGNGVVYDGFLTDGKVPGPTIIVDQGDIVEFIVRNEGTVPHGASIHAAYTQTSKYMGSIQPGEEKRVVFRATYPGVFMYHCAQGGHAIPMHVLFGQYGMMVVRPSEQQYKMEELLGHGPDVEIYLIQNEFYSSGADAVEGNAAYVTFNGRLFRYVEEPIVARPGDYVRIYFLNVGPNLLSTFHLVGIIWDFAYWQGHPEAVLPGGQTVTAGPSDSWVVEFRIPPEEGAYTMLTHAVGSASRGAIGLLVADGDADAETPVRVTADGPAYTAEEMEDFKSNAVRTISPFKPGSEELRNPVRAPEGADEVTISIIGNSYSPSVLEVEPGTTVRWVNEDVFSYLAGEFSGIHNAVSTSGPERFVSPLLAHVESYSFTFEEEGEYSYICTPHPYMEGKVIVRSRETESAFAAVIPITLSILAALLALVALLISKRRR